MKWPQAFNQFAPTIFVDAGIIPAQSHAGAFLHLLLTCHGQLWPEQPIHANTTTKQRNIHLPAAIHPAKRSWKVPHWLWLCPAFLLLAPILMRGYRYGPFRPCDQKRDLEISHEKNEPEINRFFYRYICIYIYTVRVPKTIPFWWASWNSHVVRLTEIQLDLSTRHSPTKCRWILCTLNLAGTFYRYIDITDGLISLFYIQLLWFRCLSPVSNSHQFSSFWGLFEKHPTLISHHPFLGSCDPSPVWPARASALALALAPP